MWWSLLMKEESSTMILYDENMSPEASWCAQKASWYAGVSWYAGEGQPAQAARPNIVRIYGACAVCQCVLVRIYGGVFTKDSGRSL